MDQMACSLAKEREALFLDARSRQYERVVLPSAAAIGVIDSGIAHDHATGQYRVRRRECEEAAALLGVGSLREVSVADLPRVEALPEPLNRRARHVITENARVLRAVEAFRADDVIGAGRLFRESHASMRDDFAVSLPDIDRLVALADGQPPILGARLTGGGFGGAVVMLGPDNLGPTVGVIVQQYRALTARDGRVLLPATVRA
jgi:galactokinase